MDKNINSTGSCKPFINLSWNIVAYCFLVHKKNFHSLPTICDHLRDVLLHCQNDIHDFPPKRARCLVSDVKLTLTAIFQEIAYDLQITQLKTPFLFS